MYIVFCLISFFVIIQTQVQSTSKIDSDGAYSLIYQKGSPFDKQQETQNIQIKRYLIFAIDNKTFAYVNSIECPVIYIQEPVKNTIKTPLSDASATELQKYAYTYQWKLFCSQTQNPSVAQTLAAQNKSTSITVIDKSSKNQVEVEKLANDPINAHHYCIVQDIKYRDKSPGSSNCCCQNTVSLNTSSGSSDNKLSDGAIAAIVIICFACVVMAVIGFFCYKKHSAEASALKYQQAQSKI